MAKMPKRPMARTPHPVPSPRSKPQPQPYERARPAGAKPRINRGSPPPL